MIDGRLPAGVAAQRPSAGIYNGTAHMDRNDVWAQQDGTETTADREVAHMRANTRDGSTADRFAIMQWQVTPDGATSLLGGLVGITLASVAVLPTNPALYWAAVNAMSPGVWPTVIMQDYIGVLHTDEVGPGVLRDLGAELKVLCVGLNLYMVSQNCDVSHGRHPLLSAASAAPATARPVVDNDTVLWASPSTSTSTNDNGIVPVVANGPSPPADRFHGIIYANGTVITTLPQHFITAESRSSRPVPFLGMGPSSRWTHRIPTSTPQK